MPQENLLSRPWRWGALVALIAVGVLSAQGEQLHAQDPPENNEATGTPTITGA